MSEVSESYHLRASRTSDAVDLLRRAKLKGYVYAPASGWVSFVAEEANGQPDQRIVTAATLPLLHYVYDRSRCWGFSFFKASKLVSAYRCEWGDAIQVQNSGYVRDPLLAFVPPDKKLMFEGFERRLRPKTFDDLFEAEPARTFADALSLPHHEGFSFDRLAKTFAEAPEDFPDVTAVL